MLKAVSSISNAIGALNYKGTWNANTNSPALASGVGTKGDYYVVGTAGTTTLDGISNWGIGDWAVFNGSVWQRVEGGADLNGVNLSVSGTSTLSGLTASTALALNGSKEVVSVTNTGSGNNVLASSPTITTPTVATIKSAASLTPTAFQDSANIEIGKLCRAWVYFDGTTAPPTIKKSFNVTAVGKSAGTGTYDITITNALPNAEPVVVTGFRRTGGFNEILDVVQNSNTATNVRVRNADTSGTGVDSVAVFVGVFA